MLSGPVGIAYSNDPVAISKTLVNFTKTNVKLKVIGAVMENRYYSNPEIVALSNISSMIELRSRIVGTIAGVASKIIGVVKAPGAKVARAINAYSSLHKE